MEKIVTKYSEDIILHEDSVIYFKNKFVNFKIDKLNLFIKKQIDFDIKFSYSFDKVNWSYPVSIDNWNFEYESINELNDFYISIWCKKINLDTFNATKLSVDKNIENTNVHELIITKISYDENNIEFCEDNIFINTNNRIVNTDNNWNFYDNQQTTIKRWLDTCVSVANMYGHKCIYFKTEVIEVNHTLATNVLRNVSNIKKIPIVSPDNELPQDRIVYSEWDMNMEGDFVIHIVDEIFKKAFGETKVPLSKDYLYLPIINKLFRVSSVQPVNGFMGKIGWWEVFLMKYEEDETIKISDELKDEYAGIEEFDDSFDLLADYETLLDETVVDNEMIDEKTIEEKKQATNNFSNRLVDSTHYIDLKETELQRQFYSKRLDITSVNPDNSSFPITMYNCSSVEKRVVALTYNLVDLVSKNKFNLICDKFEFSTNFVLLSKFSGELFDFINKDGLSLITLDFNRKKLSLILHTYQKTFDINYDFIENEFYQILIKFDSTFKQLSVNIYMLENKQKINVFNDLYIINSEIYSKFEFNNLYLYGGKFLTSEIILKINENKILTDNVTPVLVMNRMGLK